MPEFKSILETALYVDDMDRATTFYENILQLPSLMKSNRLCAYSVNDASVLLLFIRGGTLDPVDTGNGIIPPHDGTGPLHIAFCCTHDMLTVWEKHLREHNIEIESETHWERGGRSIYFRDPDAHLLEIASSPGLWRGF